MFQDKLPPIFIHKAVVKVLLYL